MLARAWAGDLYAALQDALQALSCLVPPLFNRCTVVTPLVTVMLHVQVLQQLGLEEAAQQVARRAMRQSPLLVSEVSQLFDPALPVEAQEPLDEDATATTTTTTESIKMPWWSEGAMQTARVTSCVIR